MAKKIEDNLDKAKPAHGADVDAETLKVLAEEKKGEENA